MKLIAVEGLLKGLILDLDEGNEWIIGRDENQCSFVLEDSSVSRKHTKITKTDDVFLIKNLSDTNPIEINEDVVVEYPLKEGDKVKIGNTTFLYTEREDEVLEDEKFEEEKPLVEETPIEEGTIFEEELEEIQEGLLEEAPFILKVISGPNAGAEFGMEKNKTYVIGKDPNSSDIVFTDLSVSKQNSQISLDGDGNVFIEDLKSKNGTYLNNVQLGKKTKISMEDLITVGTTTFLVVAQEKAFQTIYSPAPQFEEKEEEIKVKEKIWRKQFIPTRHLVLAGGAVVIIFVVFLSFFALFKSKDLEVAYKNPKNSIEKIITEFSDVEYSYNPSSANVFLVGHILTSIDKQEMLYELNQLPFIKSIDDNVIVDEGVWKNFNDTLNEVAAFRSVSVHASMPGEFVITGYVDAPKDFENLVDYINTNFPYVDKVQNRVVIEDILKAAIASKLLENNLTGITFELISSELVLAGRYEKKNQRNFNKLLEAFEKTRGIQTVKNLAFATSVMTARIDLSSKYRITGEAKINGKNVSVVANGKIVGMGDILDGMYITKITSNAILLEKDELKYKIGYSR